MREANSDFGCVGCCADDAPAALEHLRSHRLPGLTLVSEPHFAVRLFSCASCGQHFVSVYTEFISFTTGYDTDYTTYLPITEVESANLAERRMDVHDIGSLGEGRRHLQVDFPSDKGMLLTWNYGRFAVVEGR